MHLLFRQFIDLNQGLVCSAEGEKMAKKNKHSKHYNLIVCKGSITYPYASIISWNALVSRFVLKYVGGDSEASISWNIVPTCELLAIVARCRASFIYGRRSIRTRCQSEQMLLSKYSSKKLQCFGKWKCNLMIYNLRFSKYRTPSLTNKTFFCNIKVEHVQGVVHRFLLFDLAKDLKIISIIHVVPPCIWILVSTLLKPIRPASKHKEQKQ